jgi:hypothetical protein
MARDCPDRQRGSDWRNGPAPDRRGPRAIGTGDAVDREMEVSSLIPIVLIKPDTDVLLSNL